MCVYRTGGGEVGRGAGYWTKGEDEKSAEKEERSFAGLDEAPPPPPPLLLAKKRIVEKYAGPREEGKEGRREKLTDTENTAPRN